MQLKLALLATTMCALLACNGNKDVKEILKDDGKRQEILSEVLGNHEYLKQLLDSLHRNRHAVMMMHGDTAMMGVCIQGADPSMVAKCLMTNMENDSAVCKKVCATMMDHHSMKTAMMKTMGEKGMLREACTMMSKPGTSARKAEPHLHSH